MTATDGSEGRLEIAIDCDAEPEYFAFADGHDSVLNRRPASTSGSTNMSRSLADVIVDIKIAGLRFDSGKPK